MYGLWRPDRVRFLQIVPDLALLTRIALCLIAASAIPSPVFAGPRIAVPPELQRSAMLCLGEALRLCPDALASKDHGLSCILGKRRRLSAPCQGVYDKGLNLLRGGDLHLQLRPSRKP